MGDIKIYAFADESNPSFDAQIEAMKRNSLNGIELRTVDGVNVSDISPEKAKEVKSKLDANGLITWSIGSPIGKIDIETDDFDTHLEKLKHTLELAKILDSKNIRMFSFYIPDNKKICDYRSEVIDRLGKMCEIAEEYDVYLCHENEKGIYGDSPERCLEIHTALPKIKGIFDPANYVQCGYDTLSAWNIVKNTVYYMHIKDAKKEGVVVPAGRGDGNVPEIVKAFIANGGSNFTIEPHLTVFEGFSHLEREGSSSVISEYGYPDSNTAFDAACNAFKSIL